MSITETIDMDTKDIVDRMRELQSEERTRRNKIMAGVLSAYFGMPRDRILEAEMDELIDSFILTRDAAELEGPPQLGRLGEGRALIVIGESGAGKTRSLQRLFSRRQEFALSESGDGHRALISVSAPSP
jgi:predicted NACHT family NTPase